MEVKSIKWKEFKKLFNTWAATSLPSPTYWQFYMVSFQKFSVARTVAWLRFIADNAKYKNSTDHNPSRHFLFYSDKSQRITAFCHSTLHNMITSITHQEFLVHVWFFKLQKIESFQQLRIKKYFIVELFYILCKFQ